MGRIRVHDPGNEERSEFTNVEAESQIMKGEKKRRRR